MLPALLLPVLLAGPALPGEGAPSSPLPGEGPVILFLVDNSASLPPLDPDERRVDALKKMVSFVEGGEWRVILFGGSREVSVDDTSQFRNDGSWTDFYHAFLRAREVAGSYPPGTVIRMVLLTDAIVDPDPRDWPDVPVDEDLKAHSIHRTLELLREMRLPLYVILVGDPAAAGEPAGEPEQSPGLVLDMVRAANGAAAAPLAQSVAAFFADDGFLLRRFVYRVRPEEGLRKLEPAVRRIASPPSAGIELRVFGYVVLPLLLTLGVLVGLLVRSFPGPGDVEVLELGYDRPVHLASDRLHRTREGSWTSQGLSLVPEARDAIATFTLKRLDVDLSGGGLDASGLDPRDAALLPLGLDEVRERIEGATDSGTREEKIHALNLDYMARSMSPEEAEKILTRPAVERASQPALDFVRAKAHLALSDTLRERLLAPRLHLATYGRRAARRDVSRGDTVRLGRYGFTVGALEPGGRREARLHLHYHRVPSLLGLKTVLPGRLQRAFRFRRSRQRTVS